MRVVLIVDNMILHVLASIEEMGVTISRDFIKCMPCSAAVGGFYDARLGVCLWVCIDRRLSFVRISIML